MPGDALAASSPQQRLEAHARTWNVDVDETSETPTSLIASGRRGSDHVVLKIVREEGDEWHSGEALHSLRSPKMVRVLHHDPGAVLMQRAFPGTALTGLSLHGRDDEATSILLEVMASMPIIESSAFPSVGDWGASFARYRAMGGIGLPARLVEDGEEMYLRLASSQAGTRLLHGDLHGDNVLLDDTHGWLGIDPKGVIGELEFELGAMLRNPFDRPDIFASRAVIAQRLRRVSESGLGLDQNRVLQWAFAQAVLSAVWSYEDGLVNDDRPASLELAATLEPMLR
jgi:streptomycin 6-kinase